MESWIKVDRDFIRDGSLTIYEKGVLLVIQSHTNGAGSAYPSQQTIAREVPCSRSQVVRALLLLENKGLVSHENNGRGKVNIYRESSTYQTQGSVSQVQPTEESSVSQVQPTEESSVSQVQPTEESSVSQVQPTEESSVSQVQGSTYQTQGSTYQVHEVVPGGHTKKNKEEDQLRRIIKKSGLPPNWGELEEITRTYLLGRYNLWDVETLELRVNGALDHPTAKKRKDAKAYLVNWLERDYERIRNNGQHQGHTNGAAPRSSRAGTLEQWQQWEREQAKDGRVP